ncbi:lysoplasmalogenase [uncultured Lacinutrix sp.]|uniref:lysoplasmalogenase n=1 Tax=uncultured Lacinutrix sp. TaxID=574032 RepID=UPI002618AB44|nr:lysoplasmalogenase [uncultured Lacinutrix sp.]
MKYILQNKRIFFIVFSIIIGVDVFVKLTLEAFPYRFISKPLVMLSILCFFIYNRNKRVKNVVFLIGILCFLIGDFFLIDDSNKLFFLLGMLFFIAGKLIYIYKFSTNKEFTILKLLPLLIFSFIYIICLLHFIFNGLGSFTIPVLLYYFVSQILLLMAYLRLGSVSSKSYLLILFGVIAFIVSETIVALSIFHIKMNYQDSAIMIFYGLSQFMIVLGIVDEGEVIMNN